MFKTIVSDDATFDKKNKTRYDKKPIIILFTIN